MALAEGLVLGGVDLNSSPNGVYGLESLGMTPPKKKPEWVPGADSDGEALIRTPLFANRTITARVRIDPQASMDTSLEKLAAIVDQLQESEKNTGGMPLVWTPSQGTKKITFYVLTAEVTGLPISVEGQDAGWFAKTPVFTLTMTCKPFGYGEEEEVRTAIANETGLSIVTFTLANIKGDVPAEGRLVVADTAAVGRRYVEWGLQQRYYDAATKLVVDSEDMVSVAGAQSTALNAAGAYKRAGATNGSIATTLVNEPTVCCNTGVLKHIGTFRVKARIQATLGAASVAERVKLRLSYQDGEGPLRANEWQTPLLGGKLVEVDLGTITLTPAQVGTQKWLGQIEAYSGNAPAADVLHVDYLDLIPVSEGYGKARGVLSSAPDTVASFDNFTTGVLSGGLNARAVPLGAAWATSGVATDFTVESGQVTRATTVEEAEPRFAVLGAAQGNSAISVSGSRVGLEYTIGAILRWVNSSNYAFVAVHIENAFVFGQHVRLRLGVKVAGVVTILGEAIMAESAFQPGSFSIEARALLDGSTSATATVSGATAAVTGTHASLATGGALASGKGGIFDQSEIAGEAANKRHFSKVSVAQLAAIPYCIQASRSMQIRSDSTLTADSTGTYYGPPPGYRGSRFFVPQAGAEKRTSRILVKADRNDLEESDQQTIADPLTVQCLVTPRYHVIPR